MHRGLITIQRMYSDCPKSARIFRKQDVRIAFVYFGSQEWKRILAVLPSYYTILFKISCKEQTMVDWNSRNHRNSLFIVFVFLLDYKHWLQCYLRPNVCSVPFSKIQDRDFKERMTWNTTSQWTLTKEARMWFIRKLGKGMKHVHMFMFARIDNPV